MDWFILIVAGLFEIGWPLGLKMTQAGSHKVGWILVAVVSMGLSSLFLWIAQKTIPMGTAYAVWTGIGAVGAFVTGIVLFKDSADALRMISVSLIVIGIVGLRLAHHG